MRKFVIAILVVVVAITGFLRYGPARRSSLAPVGKNLELGTVMRPFLPTAPENFGTAFTIDDERWQAHASQITARWQAWLDAPQGGPR